MPGWDGRLVDHRPWADPGLWGTRHIGADRARPRPPCPAARLPTYIGPIFTPQAGAVCGCTGLATIEALSSIAVAAADLDDASVGIES